MFGETQLLPDMQIRAHQGSRHPVHRPAPDTMNRNFLFLLLRQDEISGFASFTLVRPS